MFSKKILVGKLSIFYLEFNLNEISNFLKNKQSIPPTERSSWLDETETKKYEITFLGTDPFIFYHNNNNQFSASFSGLDSFYKHQVIIEWEWINNFFVVKAEEKIIFLITDAEIIYLLLNGTAQTNDIEKDMKGEILDLEFEQEYTKKMYKSLIFRDGLQYSNNLVNLTVQYCRPSDVVHYE